MKFMRKYYSPDSLPGSGQAPENGEPDAGQDPAPTTFDAEYVTKLRNEAAKYRNEAKAAKSQLSELQPLAEKAKQLEDATKSEAEKLTQKLADMQAQLNAAQNAATQAANAQRLTVLATKAGVSADILPYLNVDKFDLDNEAETIATLEKLKSQAANTPATGGGASNPARGTGSSNGQVSPADWYADQLGKTPGIFGG